MNSSILHYHPESDCYFYNNQFNTDGLVENVTGVAFHEAEAKLRGIVMNSEPAPNPRSINRDTLVSLVNKQCETCLSCGHFVEQTELCSMFKQRPPARIIAFGCPNYDFVPF